MKKLLLSLFIVSPLLTIAQTFSASGGSVPDNNTEVCFPVTVSGLPTTINSVFGLTTVCINLTHSYDGDLNILLKSPLGMSIVLANNNGGSGNNFTNT